jgi:hypothetical protein
MQEHLQRNVSADRIGRALGLLAEAGLASRIVERRPVGRPIER